MRSPWQLIKSLASRRKSDDVGTPVEEVAAISDLRANGFEQSSAQLTELEAHPNRNSQSTGDANETDRQPAPIGADAEQTLPAVQTDPSHSQVVENANPEVHDKPAPVAPAVRTIAEEAGSVPVGSNKRRARADQSGKNRGKSTVGETAIGQRIAAKEPGREGAAELDREIKYLRLQLSAKLIEQNGQLRQMLERYGDK